MTNTSLDYNKFISKRSAWVDCLSGNDRHAIMTQIPSMIWNAAAYRIINEARRMAPPAPEGGVQLNGMVHRMLDQCFFESQSSAIRRLVDPGELDGKNKKRSVFSLMALLLDMKANAALLTREHIFKSEALDYDYEPIKKRAADFENQQQNTYFVPTELNWQRHEDRHVDIDFLSGTKSRNRQPSDSVRPFIFDCLIARLNNGCIDIAEHCNKFVAHAASEQSRKSIDLENSKVTLGHLWRAHQVICEVANFTSIYLLTGANHGMLPIPQDDHLVYIDRAFAPAEKIVELTAIWNNYEAETNKWREWDWKAFQQQCRCAAGI